MFFKKKVFNENSSLLGEANAKSQLQDKKIQEIEHLISAIYISINELKKYKSKAYVIQSEFQIIHNVEEHIAFVDKMFDRSSLEMFELLPIITKIKHDNELVSYTYNFAPDQESMKIRKDFELLKLQYSKQVNDLPKLIQNKMDKKMDDLTFLEEQLVKIQGKPRLQ